MQRLKKHISVLSVERPFAERLISRSTRGSIHMMCCHIIYRCIHESLMIKLLMGTYEMLPC